LAYQTFIYARIPQGLDERFFLHKKQITPPISPFWSALAGHLQQNRPSRAQNSGTFRATIETFLP
jgi:hypothetical protein